jgi:hypothetical protein
LVGKNKNEETKSPTKDDSGDYMNKRMLKAASKIGTNTNFLSQFESPLMAEGDVVKRKVGRPFKGEVEEFTKEPYVPERRSILRGFKKFFAKKEFDDIMGNRTRPERFTLDVLNGEKVFFMKEIYDTLDETDTINV